MPHSLPNQGDSAPAKEVVEEHSNSDGQFLDTVPVDVDVDEQADKRTGASESTPVPLPSAADGVEARVLAQVDLAVLCETGQQTNQADAVGDSDANTSVGTRTHGINSAVALCSIDPAAI